MTPRERVNAAIRHEMPDRTPRDFAAEPAIWSKLLEKFHTDNREDVLRFLEIDCRVLSYDDVQFVRHPNRDAQGRSGMWKHEIAPDLFVDIWGAHRRTVRNEWSSYEDLCDYPLAEVQSREDLKKYDWPQPDWWDFTTAAEVADSLGKQGHYHLRYRVGAIFETAWSLRGFDRFLLDLMENPELAHDLLERILEIHLENLRQVMQIAGDRIDMVYTYDDLAHQQGLLISPATWRRMIRPYQARLFGKAKEYGKTTMYHCCGAVRPLLSDMIDIGVDVINPVQPLAKGMNLAELKAEFGTRLTFHGGIDIQKLLPQGTPEEVRDATQKTCQLLGEQGGYILSPAHHVQADTPLENIFAMFDVNP